MSEISTLMMNSCSSADVLSCMICGFTSHASLTSHISRKHSDIGTKGYRLAFPDSPVQKDKRTPELRKSAGIKHSQWFKNEENKIEFMKKRSFPSEMKHWMNKGFSEEEAQKLCSEHQRKTALRQNNERTKQHQRDRSLGDRNAMSLSSLSQRYGVTIEEAKKLTPGYGKGGKLHPMYGKHHSDEVKKKIVTNMRHTFSHTSLGEKSLQNAVKKLFPNAKCNAPVETFNVDILIPEKLLIVEYFGDFWHCNPNKWQAEDYNRRLHMTAKEKWQQDEKRTETLKQLGYKVVVVWESTYKLDGTLPEEILYA